LKLVSKVGHGGISFPFAFRRKGKETEVNLGRKGGWDIGKGGRRKGKGKKKWGRGREGDEFCAVVIL